MTSDSITNDSRFCHQWRQILSPMTSDSVTSDVRFCHQWRQILSPMTSDSVAKWRQILSPMTADSVTSDVRFCHQWSQILSSVTSDTLTDDVRFWYKWRQILSQMTSDSVTNDVRFCHKCSLSIFASHISLQRLSHKPIAIDTVTNVQNLAQFFLMTIHCWRKSLLNCTTSLLSTNCTNQGTPFIAPTECAVLNI